MDLVLVTITGISLILAVSMGLVVFKLLRDERQRSDARVAMLKAAATPDGSSPPLRQPAQDAPLASSDSPAVARMFTTSETDSPWRRRIAAAAAVAAVLAGAGYTLLPQDTGRAGGGVRAAARAFPLELLALEHIQDADGLTIAGVVRNPRAGRPVSRVLATASLFGPDGDLAASSRAPLDYAMLGPGEESPFVIKVPVTGGVGRYRVGFRGHDGVVIPHVDRRTDGASARNGRFPGSEP